MVVEEIIRTFRSGEPSDGEKELKDGWGGSLWQFEHIALWAESARNWDGSLVKDQDMDRQESGNTTSPTSLAIPPLEKLVDYAH